MGTQELPVDYVVPVHLHEIADEVLFITSGHATATLDGAVIPVSPGTTLYIPRGSWHGVRNTSGQPAQMLWFVSPPGLEEFFREASQPPGTPWSPLPPDVIDEIAARYGTMFQASEGD